MVADVWDIGEPEPRAANLDEYQGRSVAGSQFSHLQYLTGGGVFDEGHHAELAGLRGAVCRVRRIEDDLATNLRTTFRERHWPDPLPHDAFVMQCRAVVFAGVHLRGQCVFVDGNVSVQRVVDGGFGREARVDAEAARALGGRYKFKRDIDLRRLGG